MEMPNDIKEFKNFVGVNVEDESGLIPTSMQSGVPALAMENVEVDDGTVTYCKGATNLTTTAGEVEYDATITGSTISAKSYRAFNGTFYDGLARPTTRVRLLFTDAGEMLLFSPVDNKFMKVATPFAGLKAGQGISHQVYNWFSSTEEADWSLLFAGIAGCNPLVWNSKYDYVDSATANTIVITGDYALNWNTVVKGNGDLDTVPDTTYHNKLLISGVEYTYTSWTPGTKTFGGVTPDPSALAQGTLVIQQIETGTTRYGQLVNASTNGVFIAPSIFAKHKGRLVCGSEQKTSSSFSMVDYPFISALPGSPAADDPIHVKNIDGDGCPTAIVSGRSYIYYFKQDAIVPMKLDVSSSGSTLTQLLLSNKSNCGCLNVDGALASDNNVAYMNANNEVGQVKPLSNGVDLPELSISSDKVTNVLDNFDQSYLKMALHRDKWYFALRDPSRSGAGNNVLVVYDSKKGSFIFRSIPIGAFYVEDGLLYGCTWGTPRVLLLEDSSTTDLEGTAQFRHWIGPRHNLGLNFRRKKPVCFGIRGRINKAANPTVKVYMNQNGSWAERQFQLKGDGSSTGFINGNYLISDPTSSAYGLHPFGLYPFGGTSDDNEDGMRDFLAVISLSATTQPYDFQVELTDDSEGAKFKMYSYAFWLEDTPTLPNNSTATNS